MTKFKSKILLGKDSESNDNNQSWWENNPMTYDWEKTLGELEYSEEYFKSIDEIFGQGHSLLGNPSWPEGRVLEKFIPYESFAGKNVLEID